MLNRLLVLAAAVCVPASLSLCILRLRRPRADRTPAVFALADAAVTGRIRRQAQEAVIAFGEELQDESPSGDALDAYQAATMVLDSATSLADLAGVLVLVNIGRGGQPLCLFNPLHGSSARQVTWRLLGTREQLRVPACGASRFARPNQNPRLRTIPSPQKHPWRRQRIRQRTWPPATARSHRFSRRNRS
jgi:hypothetical protein